MYSDSTVASRRHRTFKAPKKLPAAKYSNLPLPFELRDQILTELLLVESQFLRLQDAIWPCLYYGHIIDYNASANRDFRALFRNLTQVSRNLRADAINVLLFRNKWRLEISFFRAPDFSYQDRLVFLDTAALARKFWGLDAVLQMRDVKIVIHNENKFARTRVQASLQTLAKTLCMSGRLRYLEVEWRNFEVLATTNDIYSWWWNVFPQRRLTRREVDRTRESTRHFRNGVSRWEAGERVLKPFENIRGVEEAVVTGYVTDLWADYLEKCMMSKKLAVNKVDKKIVPKQKHTAGIPNGESST